MSMGSSVESNPPRQCLQWYSSWQDQEAWLWNCLSCEAQKLCFPQNWAYTWN
ncbi:hypothetical protein TRIATDRAFT_294018 [Trichoderma atroviride IMI 206040]|uniref:Uncharacterized protein n=1 Tax=Hypocrea atroviridis (strain ATCC 20476 / IMI 206040) TaxID=452589 RepID=G9P375_HYPAI|nr:uncharacterized protein TRIATDRAFT_294018 [Trichoderma atroviride IMI 206040]EHK42838.1 hypothetical protein TRIATDRAFT_294018 [Trichoderma atroviride IMI 206040]